MQVSELNLFHLPKDRLRLTVGEDRSYLTVKPVWAAPLSHPGKYLALLDGKGEEIVTLPEPNALPKASHQAVQEEIARRYLTATIESVSEALTEFGATYWHVETDRGPRDFVTQSLSENVQWLTPTHVLLTDVDGNRFELKDVSAMDERSRKLIEGAL
ncbi:DUF1854 domain-containing protein [bacterium]|nr:MAG: DUF1854 domain-containing protein [bacterium]